MQYNTRSMIALTIFLGALIGLLVNYLADVLPYTRRFTPPACPSCSAPFSLSAWITGADCPYCRRSRALRFWAVVIALAAASALAWVHPPARIGYWPGLLLLGYFGTVFVIDMEHRLILHPTSLVGAALALGLGWLAHGPVPTLTGALGGFLIMLALYGLGWLFTRLRARRMAADGEPADDEEALGQGDVILAVILGLLLGWPLIWFGLLAGILLGGFFSLWMVISMLLAKRYKKQALMTFMPYGPFLILSAYLILFQPQILRAILPG